MLKINKISSNKLFFKVCFSCFLIVLLTLIIIFSPNLQALNPLKKLHQYTHINYQIENGLPQNTVLCIKQTSNGYIWFGTQEGLVRFDGRKFKIFDKKNTPALKSNWISTLLEDKSGALWIGTYHGLVKYNNNKFTVFTTEQGLTSNIINTIIQDKSGALWIGTQQGGITIFENNVFKKLITKNTTIPYNINSLHQDKTGTIWISTTKGIKWYKNEKIQEPNNSLNEVKNSVTSKFYSKESNELWISTRGKGLYKYKNKILTNYNKENGLLENNISTVFKDMQGVLWIGGDTKGLVRLYKNEFNYLNSKQKQIVSITSDNQGNLYFGTSNSGLNILKDGPITSYTTKDGLSHDIVYSVFEDNDNNLWIGTDGGGLNLYKDDKFKSFSIENDFLTKHIISICKDNSNTLWLGTWGNGVMIYKNNKFVKYNEIPEIQNSDIPIVYCDKDNTIWISAWGFGLYSIDSKSNIKIFGKKEGFNHIYISSILKDKSNTLWLGTNNNGIYTYKNGKLKNYTVNDGLAYNYTSCFYEDNEGNVWIGSLGGGLTLYQNGKFTKFESLNGLYDDLILSIVEDNYNRLWFSCNKGIFSVEKREFFKLKRKKIEKINSVHYGKLDGMKSRECNGGVQPAGWKDNKGNIWFPTQKGIVKIDPKLINLSEGSPEVYIENIIADDKAIKIDDYIELSPETEKIEFHYTALAFKSRNKIQFKYKLVGFDKNWVNAGRRDIAYYTNLLPGKYIFKVKACNTQGKWDSTYKSISFVKEAHFYQVKSFFILCIFILIILIFISYKISIKQIELKHKKLKSFNVILKNEVERQTIKLKGQKHIIELTNEKLAKQNEKVEKTNIKLMELDYQKTEFFQNISHELRTALTLILNPLVDISKSFPDNNEIKLAKNNSLKLLTLLDQLIKKEFLKSDYFPLSSNKLTKEKDHENYNNIKSIFKSSKIENIEDIKEFKKTTEQKTILVVDDIEDIRQLIKSKLISQGYYVYTAENGEQGIKQANKQKPDLIISDWMMPVMSGIEMISLLKKDKNLMSIPVVILTAKTEVDSRVEGIESGADGYLSKPFNDEELISIVKNLLKLKEQEYQLLKSLKKLNIAHNELKSTKDKMIQQSRMAALGNLVQGVSHEIGNPLNSASTGFAALKKFTEELIQLADTFEKQGNSFEEFNKKKIKVNRGMRLVEEGLKRISQIINNLRSYIGTGSIQYEQFNIKSNIEMSLELLKNKLNSKNIIIESNLEDLPEVKCKTGQLNQVITNLIVNSYEVIPNGGKIIIEGKLVNGHIELLFKDTGPGVPKDIKNKIFDPFFSNKEKINNQGLGLYISHEIINNHKGELHLLESDKGAVFLIKLPIT